MAEAKISKVDAARAYVKKLLKEQLAEGMLYHDYAHTKSVWQFARKIGNKENLGAQDLELLQIAALFHDTGFVKIYAGHEEASVAIATDYLSKNGFEADEISKVVQAILATKMHHVPKNQMEKIIRDADMNHVGSKGYAKRIAGLRSEWVTFCNQTMTDEEWQIDNVQFLENHTYYTESAQAIFQATKLKNLKKMKAEKKEKPAPASSLAGSKSAQMMFKTALRNHIDLTNLADNKANIMLSINAIIITISLPYIPGYVAEDPHLILPAGLLITTCLASVIVATMATRPIAMKGTSSIENIKNGSANLFFFGNFYKMTQSEYYGHLTDVIADEALLEKSIISDLYHLGASMGKKYKLLRLCYTIFMVGMSLTVISLLFLPLLNHSH